MSDKSGLEIFLEYVPSMKIAHKVLITYTYQFVIFILLIACFWWISSKILIGALIGQFVITFCLTLPYVYIISHIDKIRKKYRSKYGSFAYERFFYRFIIYIPPFGNASALLPLLLIRYDFLPEIINLPNHIITDPLFPFYSSIPIGIILLVIGTLIRRPSGGFDVDTQLLVYIIFPEKSRKIDSGIYKFIRHPQYSGEGIAIMGIGIIANNILAICVSLIHFFAYLLIVKVEDAELLKRFGDDIKEYQKNIPTLYPKYGCWKNFLRFIFKRN